MNDLSLESWVSTFAKRKRPAQHHYLIDGFDHEFYLLFDFDECEEAETKGTCDILAVLLQPLEAQGTKVTLVSNANKHGIMRLLAALGIHRFNEKVKAAFYSLGGPLRAEA